MASTTASSSAKKRRLSNLTLLCIGGASLWASLWVSKHFIVETLVAGFLVVLCKPLQNRLARGKLGKSPHLLASLLTVAVVILILLPIALLVVLLVGQIIHAVDFVREQIGNGGLTQIFSEGSPVARLWAKVQHVMPISTDELKEQALGATKLIAPTLGGILSFSGETFLGGLVLIFATFYFFVDGDALGEWVVETLPLDPRYSHELFVEFRSVSYAMVVGSTLTALATGVIASVGYWMLGVPSPLVWGTLTGLCQVAPAVGNMLIWVPVVVLLALSGHIVHAIILAIYCAVLLGVLVDNLLRPLIVSRSLSLHPFLIFLGILGGVTMLGIPGLVIGPLVFAFAIACLRIYKRDFVSPAEAIDAGG